MENMENMENMEEKSQRPTPSLTGKQKRHLRSLGQRLPDAVTIGKAGLTDAVAQTIGEVFAVRELIKVRLKDERGAQRKTAAADLAKATGSQCVGITGRTVLLYRPNPKLEAGQRINLP